MQSQNSFLLSREIRLSSSGRRERLPRGLLGIMSLHASTSSGSTTGLGHGGWALREPSLLDELADSPPIGMGVHKTRLHVPPFVPHRVVAQRVFVGPDFEETVAAEPLHIECPSKEALTRRIADIDKGAAFVWFSGESETQARGAVMVYLPDAFDARAPLRGGFDVCGAFYVGFSQRSASWKPAMLRGISRNETAHLEESARALMDRLA